MAFSPRFMKRFLSAILLGPVALMLMTAHPLTFMVVCLAALIISLYEWWGLTSRVAKPQRFITGLIGFFYIPICFYTFAVIRLEDPAGWFPILTLLLAVWTSDTGAYMFGKTYGGPKLVPHVSPNKTWAGLGGAMIGAGLVFMVTGLVLYSMKLAPFQYLHDFMLGALLGFVCQVGDLFISVFKRWAGLKDTGQIIPGHGGLLDRIDSLMLASAFFFLITKWPG